MESIRAIIVDDEERARNYLANLISIHSIPVNVLASCKNVPDAVMAINLHKPDVVFLDVEMPEYNGFELIRFFSEVNFEIVFVTAYSDYAIKAFEISAIDYLLKPLEPEALKAAVEKVTLKRQAHNMNQRLQLFQEAYEHDEFKRIAVPVADGMVFIEVAKIVCIEASGAYTNVWLIDGSKLLVSKKLIFFEKVLEKRKLMYRIHRSYIINFNCIKKYSKAESYVLLDNNMQIPIPKEKKAEFEELMKDIRVG